MTKISKYLLIFLVGLSVLLLLSSVLYHNIQLIRFSNQLESWATQNNITDFVITSMVSSGSGSGPFCSYLATLEIPIGHADVDIVSADFLQEPFSPAEPSQYPKIDKSVETLADKVIMTIYDGSHSTLLDYRCL